MSFKSFVASTRDTAAEMGIRLSMAKLNDAISIAVFDKPYAQCIAAENVGKLPPPVFPARYLHQAADQYRLDRVRFAQALDAALSRQPQLPATPPGPTIPHALHPSNKAQALLTQRAHDEIYACLDRSRTNVVDGDGVLEYSEDSSANYVWRLALVRGADGLTIGQFSVERPDTAGIAHSILHGLSLLAADPSTVQLGLAKDLATDDAVTASLRAHRVTISSNLNGVRSLVARARDIEAALSTIRFSLHHQSEGPPTLQEVHSIAPEAKGWLVVPWSPPIDAQPRKRPVEFDYADVITRLRGRDPADGHRRSMRSPHGSPLNTHAASVPERDPLDQVIDAMNDREEYVYDYITLQLVDDFRQWEQSGPAERLKIEHAAPKFLFEAIVDTHTERPALPCARIYTDVGYEFGIDGVWRHMLDRWTDAALARGLSCHGSEVRELWVRVTLAGDRHAAAPWIRRLPCIPTLIQDVRRSASAQTVFVDFSQDQRDANMPKHQADAIRHAALSVLTRPGSRGYAGNDSDLQKPQVVDDCRVGESRPLTFCFPAALISAPQGVMRPLAALDASTWIEAANRKLARWQTACHVQGVEFIRPERLDQRAR
jgi:hypothetical protein